VSLVEVLSAAAVVVTGGYSARLGPVRLSSHNVPRDLVVAALAAFAAAIVDGRDRVDALAVRSIVVTERAASWMAAALVGAVLIFGMRAGTRCACGADQYGYVSQADLWASATLHVPVPLASAVPWPDA